MLAKSVVRKQTMGKWLQNNQLSKWTFQKIKNRKGELQQLGKRSSLSGAVVSGGARWGSAEVGQCGSAVLLGLGRHPLIGSRMGHPREAGAIVADITKEA